MDMLFTKVLNMSISASWLVLVVLALRLMLKQSPKWVHVALWALVAVRLICPWSPESEVSLVPEKTTEHMVQSLSGGYYGDAMIYSQGSWEYDAAVAAGVAPSVGDNDYHYVLTQPDDPTKPAHTAAAFFGQIWIVGMVLMFAWALTSYLRLRKKVSASLALGNGVFLCDYIDTPFILGIAKPQIYLPSSMEPDSASHVLAHERAHIARKDHWWKPLGYLLLTVHWFNPFVWLSYILLCRDIELACDEKVINQMALPQRKSYSEALLKCSVSRRHIAACPLAFGEVGVKERVKTVLNYKKPAFWIVVIAILALIVTGACFLTDPVSRSDTIYRVEQVVYRNPAISYYMTEEDAPLFQITGDNNLRIKELDEEWADLGEFTEIQLSELNFDALFWGFDQGQPWEEAYEAWMLALPQDEIANSTKFYLLLRQNGGLYLGEGIAFTNVYPLHEHILDATLSVNWLYRLCEHDPSVPILTEPAGESPYAWASTLKVEELTHCSAALGHGDWSSDPLKEYQLRELVALLNQVPEEQFVSRLPEGEYDPKWNFDGVNVHIFLGMDRYVLLRYAQDTVMIDADSDSPAWDEKGNWVIENQALKDWLQKLSYGGSYMLSEDNREEIRQLLRVDYVEFFSPQEFGDQLFIGCGWDTARGMGIACFEKQNDGYKLLKLIRGAELKTCASGSKLYYADYNALRLFLVMNESVTAMEWTGMTEKTVLVESPALVVEYFPEGMAAEYRFRYNGGTTMYMDRDNNVISDNRETPLRDPKFLDELMQVATLDAGTVGVTEDVDEYYRQITCRVLDQWEAMHVWFLLSAMPESAVEPATEVYSRDKYLDLSFLDGKTGDYRSIQLAFDNGTVYYSLVPQGSSIVTEFWKLDYPELEVFLNQLFGEDRSDWENVIKYPKSEGQISFEAHGVKVSMPKLRTFEYEQTAIGIRFRPWYEESWVELQYHVEPFAVCGTGLQTVEVDYGRYSGIRGFYDDNEYWSFLDLTAQVGDVAYNIVLLNEDTWVSEFDAEIVHLLNAINFEVVE